MSKPKRSQRSLSIRKKRFILIVVLFSFAGLAADFIKFAQGSLHQARIAMKEASQLLPEPTPEEAIVVLTGDGGRIPKGIELLRQRQSPVLLISGAGKGATLRNLVNQQGQSAAHIHEVWDRILVESDSQTTVENAIISKRLLSPRQVKRIILVTSDYHMWRATRIFKAVYPEVEYFEFPVSSSVADLANYPQAKMSLAMEGIWRLFSEYGRTLLFRLNRLRGAI